MELNVDAKLAQFNTEFSSVLDSKFSDFMSACH